MVGVAVGVAVVVGVAVGVAVVVVVVVGVAVGVVVVVAVAVVVVVAVVVGVGVGMNRKTLAVGLGLIGAFATGVVVPRINEAGTVAKLLASNPTIAYGPVHVTTDSTSAKRMAIWSMEYEGGIVDAIMHDPHYRRALVVGLGAAHYTDMHGNMRVVESVTPVVYRPDMLRVSFHGGEWMYVARARFDNIAAGHFAEGAK